MMRPELSEREIEAFGPDAKIGLLATRDAAGLPHVTLITSLHARGPRELMWGQFCDGRSKAQVRAEARVGFAVMSMDRKVWRGTARWTHARTEGEDYVAYNRKPLFRYNSYFGIHTVHYMQLVGVCGPEPLRLPRVVAGTLLTSLAAPLMRQSQGERALSAWAEAHLSRAATLKFLAWVGEDGFPTLVPVVPARAAGPRRLVFAPSVYGDELARLTPGQPVAVFALNLQMESVLVRGAFAGFRGPLRTGVLELDWVYNSMPPQQGQIYPRPPLEAVRAF